MLSFDFQQRPSASLDFLCLLLVSIPSNPFLEAAQQCVLANGQLMCFNLIVAVGLARLGGCVCDQPI